MGIKTMKGVRQLRSIEGSMLDDSVNVVNLSEAMKLADTNKPEQLDDIEDAVRSEIAEQYDEPQVDDPRLAAPTPTSAAPINPVVERAYNEPIVPSFTKHSDNLRNQLDIMLANAVQRGESIQTRIRELETEYLDVLVETGMIKKALEYKERE